MITEKNLENVLPKLASPWIASSITKRKIEDLLLLRIFIELEELHKKDSYHIEIKTKKPYQNGEADVVLVHDITNEIVCVVEAKQYYTFDIVMQNWYSDLCKKISNDITKLETKIKQNLKGSINRFFILFFTHYHKLEVPPFFKYNNGKGWHNETMKEKHYHNADQLLIEAQENLQKKFQKNPFTTSIGIYREVPIYLLTLILKNEEIHC